MARLGGKGIVHEYHGNIHMHTTYSDGSGTFAELIEAARRAGLDYVYVTDHNLLVREQEQGYRQGVLVLVGQEVHDVHRPNERSHLLCLGVDADVTPYAPDPQALIDAVMAQPQGLAFLAHPIEEYTRLYPDHYDWEHWQVTGYTGVELWNYMARFRGYTTSQLRTLLLGFFPHWFTEGPLPAMLAKWDALCQERPVVAIGGTDVHAKTYHYGPIPRLFLSYLHCARALNTHILCPEPFAGPTDTSQAAFQSDQALVLQALAAGHCWIGYDLVAPTRGFRFSAHATAAGSEDPQPAAIMGDRVEWVSAGGRLELRVEAPAPAEIRLYADGRLLAQAQGTDLRRAVDRPGVYRVEVWKRRWGKRRGWIFANPIYVRGG